MLFVRDLTLVSSTACGKDIGLLCRKEKHQLACSALNEVQTSNTSSFISIRFQEMSLFFYFWGWECGVFFFFFFYVVFFCKL